MTERIKLSLLNFLLNVILWSAYATLVQRVETSIYLLVFFVNILIGIADVFLLDGEKHNKRSYTYLKINRALNFVLAWKLCLTANSAVFWFLAGFYLFESCKIIKEQYYSIGDDIHFAELDEDYKSTMYELSTILDMKQKKILEELRSVVDEDKMFGFIVNFHADEIKRLLNVEMWGLAFLIQKEDYDSMLKIVEKNI